MATLTSPPASSAGVPRDNFEVVALIAAFNEGDIISAVIGHLAENGISVYLIDNHSTDDTIAQAQPWLGRGLLGIESFPKDGRKEPGPFDWSALLRRKEELSRELPASWFIHHDADEVRESPWPGVSLKQAIRWVDAQGYNSIDFRVFNFVPVDDGFRQGDDPRTYFSLCEPPGEFDKLQIKAWKATSSPVSLLPSGGHSASFEGRRVFPIPFLLRHYPIRGQKHGVRKVFDERKGRFVEAERAQGWHIQYDTIIDSGHKFVRAATELQPFNLDAARLECMLPEVILRNLSERLLRADAELERAQSQAQMAERGMQEYREHATALEGERERLLDDISARHREHSRLLDNISVREREHERERNRILDEIGVREREHASLTQMLEEYRRGIEDYRSHASNLERVREELEQRIVALESERRDLLRTLSNCERCWAELKSQTDNLELSRTAVEQQLAGTRAEMQHLRETWSWRVTAPFRRIADLFGRR